jgi:flavin-dependent dehydrogenase
MLSLDADTVIVGGGPAGITTAIALARAARRLVAKILVLEADVYPRDKYCAGALGGRGLTILEELDAVPEIPWVSIDGMSFRAEGGEAVARVSGIGRVIRRIEFDHALAQIAVRLGVRVVQGARVTSIEERDGGAVLETTQGTVRARAVVGADGVGSVVRKAMGLGRGKLGAQVLEVDTDPVASDRPRDLLHFDASDRRFSGYCWDFPTNVGGRELVCRGIYHLKLDKHEVDIRALLDERLRAMGLDVRAYKNKRFAERGFELGGEVARGRMMLVGEAAGIDPITGEGIAQAIEYGAMAGRFLAGVMDRGERVETWGKVVRGSHLAKDLSIRARALGTLYGEDRPRMERFITGDPDALYAGCQYFGAKDVDKGRLIKALFRGGLALLDVKWRRSTGAAVKAVSSGPRRPPRDRR